MLYLDLKRKVILKQLKMKVCKNAYRARQLKHTEYN